MKKITLIVLTLFSFLASSKAIAQQGFGTNQPDRSAAVDIVSSKRGLLIPRLSLTSTTVAAPVNSPAESLLVYNTATTGDVTPGYYYWDADPTNAKWVRFVSATTEKTVTVSAGENVTVSSSTTGNTTDYEVAVAGGTDGQVLVTRVVAGVTSTVWVDPATFINGVVTASNGLNINASNDVRLGGTLTEATEITTDNTNTLAITGLDDVSATFDSTTQNIVVMGADGVLKLVSPQTLVADNETVTVFRDNADGTFTYYSESEIDAAGNVVTGATGVIIDTNASALGYVNTTSGLTATNVQAAIDEIVTELSSGGGVTLVDRADGTFDLVSADNTVLSSITKSNLTDNTDGSYTFSNNDGTDITVDVLRVKVSLNPLTNLYEFQDSSGAVIGSIDMNASNVAFSNTASGLTATNVQAAIDEIVTELSSGGGVTLVDRADGTFDLVSADNTVLSSITKSNLTDNTDGSYTFSNNDGTDITVDVLRVKVSLNPLTNLYEFQDSSGAVIGSIDMNASNVAFSNTASGLTATNVQAAIDEIVTELSSGGGVTLVDRADGTFDLVSADNTVLSSITKSNLTDNTDGSYTFSNNDGTDITVDVLRVKVSLNPLTNLYEFQDSSGAVIGSIDMNASNVAFSNTASGLTATNVQAAIDEIVTNTVTADNGLTKTGNNVQLGGTLITPTVITADATNTLAIAGLQNSAANSAAIVLADETTGVLRKVARSLEYTTGVDFTVASQTGYNKFVQEITILVTIGTSDLNINLPTAADAKGQVINVKIANSTEPDAYVNIPNVDGVTIYGSMPYQGWIIKSNGTSWSLVGRI